MRRHGQAGTFDPLARYVGSLHLKQDIARLLEVVIKLDVDLETHLGRSDRYKMPSHWHGDPATTLPDDSLFLKCQNNQSDRWRQ